MIQRQPKPDPAKNHTPPNDLDELRTKLIRETNRELTYWVKRLGIRLAQEEKEALVE